MATETRVWPDVAIPPGEFLAETLRALGLSQAELARRAGRPVQVINEIVRGRKEITPETALQLERVLGVPAHIWTRLEADYRHVKARLEDQARLKDEIVLAERYPYAAMAAYGWVARSRDSLVRVTELLKFFGVASLRHVPQAECAAFRRSAKVDASPESLAAWLRQGEREAHRITTTVFKVGHLRAILPELRRLTTRPPEAFQPRLRHFLADGGVAFAVVPHLPATGAYGATRWLGPDKALVQMSIRYRWDDIFWFSLFHEVGHLLLHERGDVFIEDRAGRGKQETEADAFARDLLIPPREYAAFVQRSDYRLRASVCSFARQQGIAPSLVVGRLQHDGRIPHSQLNGLRSRFAWVSASAA